MKTGSWIGIVAALISLGVGCSTDDGSDGSSSEGVGGSPAAVGGANATGGASSGGSGTGGSGTGASSAAGGSGSAASTGGSGGLGVGGTAGAGGASTGGSGGVSNTGGESGSGGTGGNAAGGSASGGGGTGGTTHAELGPATVWLAGDSTVANGNTPCPVGWGKAFDGLFDDRITVVNSAVGGRSVRTWLYDVQSTKDNSTGECVLTMNGSTPVLQPRWQNMLDNMKEGDFLLIQFGINDGDPNCPRHVGVNALKESYIMMANAAKERGAQPVFITPVSAIACNGATPKGTRGFVQTVIDAGAEQDVPVIDLHARSIALYGELGFCPIPGGDVSSTTGGAVGTFFCDDHTHFDTPGAAQIGELVADGLVDAGVALAEYLK